MSFRKSEAVNEHAGSSTGLARFVASEDVEKWHFCKKVFENLAWCAISASVKCSDLGIGTKNAKTYTHCAYVDTSKALSEKKTFVCIAEINNHFNRNEINETKLSEDSYTIV